MKAVHLSAFGGPADLVYEDAPQPTPGAGEALIKVYATAVTPTEIGWYPTSHTTSGDSRKLPVILGHEFSGLVVALGTNVNGVNVGTAVYGLTDWFRDGTNAEFCVARAEDFAGKPNSIDHVHAAVVPISALTAWQGLVVHARVQKGMRVLVQGAAGGVGNFAVQLAHRFGAHVIATVSGHNVEFIRQLGADEVIDYQKTQFEDVVRDVDVVFDAVGGDTLHRSLRVLKKDGALVTVASDRDENTEQRIKDAFFIVEPDREQLTEIAALIDSGELKPIVDSIYALSQARKAYEHKPLRGKCVLKVLE